MKGENGITKVVAESNYNYSYNNLKDYSDRNDMRGFGVFFLFVVYPVPAFSVIQVGIYIDFGFNRD